LSYSPVYSSQFIVHTGTAPNSQFEVPAGFTAVIRQITVASFAAAVEWDVTIQNDASAPACAIAVGTLAAIAEATQQQLHVVVPAAGFIIFNNLTVGDNCNAYVGGYLLTNVVA